MLITLEGERPVTWNTLYAGKHWAKRHVLAKSVHDLVRYSVLEQHPGVKPFDERVSIVVRVYFDKRPHDCCNIPAKIYIDGLHGLVIYDDDIRYVASVTTVSLVDKDNPRVEIEVNPEE